MLVLVALPGTTAAGTQLPPYGYPLRQAPQCAGANICPGDRGPSLSPDGKQIAFMRYDARAHAFDLMTMNVDGSAVRDVSPGYGHWSHPQWSPDGTRLMFECGEIVCATGPNGLTPLSTSGNVEERMGQWSPDGTRVVLVRYAYAYGSGWCCQVFVVGADATNPVVIGGGPGQPAYTSPVWSPDGRQLAFLRNGEVWTSNADGTEQQEIQSLVDGSTPTVIDGWYGTRIYVQTSSELASIDEHGGGVDALAVTVYAAPNPLMVGTIGEVRLAPPGVVTFVRVRPDGSESLEVTNGQDEIVVAAGVSAQSPRSFSDFSALADGEIAYLADGGCPARIGIYLTTSPTKKAVRLTQQCAHRQTSGPDFIAGTNVAGGPGDDRLVAGHAPSTISGGPGWDAIVSRNGYRDRISCGPGDDIVWADQLDAVAGDCEVVLRKTITLPPPLPRTGTIALTCTLCGFPPGSPGQVWLIRPNGRRMSIPFDTAGAVRFSPNGRWIADAEEGQIHVHSVRGSADVSLTSPAGGAQDDDAAWLDDHTLVFVRSRPRLDGPGSSTTLERIDFPWKRAPSPLFQDFDPNNAIGFPDASRNGTIAFADESGQLWAEDRGGGGRHELTLSGVGGFDPRWSPDGTHVAVLVDAGGTKAEVVDVTSGGVRRFPFAATALAWSPDGRWLALAAGRTLEIVDLATGAARTVFTAPRSGTVSSVDWTNR